MQISRFILDNVDSILQAWEDFAANIISASKLNKAELRDHAKGMLIEIAADIGTHQSKREQSDKSKGIKTVGNKNNKMSSINHGLERMVDGFSINEIISEFRALRASVLALLAKTNPTFLKTDIEDLTRFNEAIDQAITESVTSYSTQKESQARLFSTVLQSSPDKIFIFDLERRFTFVNKAGEATYGMPQKSLIGKTFLEVELTFAHEIHQSIKKVIDSKRNVICEIVHPTKMGAKHEFEYILAPVMSKNQQVEAVVCFSRDITKRKATEELSWHKANYDVLTGLPNRRLFNDRLEHDIKHSDRTGLPIALMFIDLDLFKVINDNFGHHAGDDLLQQVSKRIDSCIRKTDTLARLGGDEFIVTLTDIASVEHVETISKKIVEEISKPFKLKDKTAKISCSVGITFYPMDATTPETLLKNSDAAMYKAKSEGRNQACFFSKL